MARLAEGSTGHWLTPSRRAEVDLDGDVARAIHATAATADTDAVGNAIAAAWTCGRAYWRMLADRAGRKVPTELFTELDDATMQ